MNGINKKKLLWIIPAIAIISAIAGAILLGRYLYEKNGWFLPKFITWTSVDESVTFGDETVHILLKNKHLSISSDNTTLYETPADYFVSDVYCFDIDHDSELEVCMMLWKKGSFGDHKPFFATKEQEKLDEYTQHIFIYDWDPKRPDRLDPIWMSSDMGMDVASMSIDEYNTIFLTDKNNITTRWGWFQWGLVNCD